MAPANVLNVGYDSTNYYLIGTPVPKLLVDIGWPGTLPKLAHALQRYDLQLKNIPYALATHYHPDHAGLAQEAKQHGVKLIVMENQIETMQPKEIQHLIPFAEMAGARQGWRAAIERWQVVFPSESQL